MPWRTFIIVAARDEADRVGTTLAALALAFPEAKTWVADDGSHDATGERALSAGSLEDVLPFAQGFGMEVGMTIDAVRAGHRVLELELDLAHRATGRSLAGFVHRGRQLADFARAYLSRRQAATARPPRC